MRGEDKRTGELFSYADLEKRVRSDHPVGAIRGLVSEALVALEHEFSALFASIGRPSIPPEKLLLQAFNSIRSERLLMERLDTICCSAGSSDTAARPCLQSQPGASSF
jgi:hypothetical protein